MTLTIAALFVETGGCYFGIDGVDPWDEARDADAIPQRVAGDSALGLLRNGSSCMNTNFERDGTTPTLSHLLELSSKATPGPWISKGKHKNVGRSDARSRSDHAPRLPPAWW